MLPLTKTPSPRRLSCAAFVACLVLLAVAAPAAAQPGLGDGTQGCILREPGRLARFVVAGAPDKASAWRAMQDDAAARPASRLVDGCRLGLRRELTAATYALLAARRPDRFAPLDAAAAAPAASPTDPVPRLPNYRFVDLTAAYSSDTTFFFPAQPWGRSGVLGTLVVFGADGSVDETVVVVDGPRIEPLGKGSAGVANASGTVGGSVLVDPENFLVQAALFRGGQRTLIPLLPDTAISFVIGITGSGVALVESILADFSASVLTLWDGWQHRPLDFGPEVSSAGSVRMNSRGVISGTTREGDRPVGFRHDTRTGATTLLRPLPSEPNAWALDINTHGDVLGYSFVWGGIERIGTWDARGNFRVRTVQGTPEVPTISNQLNFNDTGVIAISRISRPAAEVGRIYLLPPGGPRIDVAPGVQGLPAGASLDGVWALDSIGNLLGNGFDPGSPTGYVDFLLLRSGR